MNNATQQLTEELYVALCGGRIKIYRLDAAGKEVIISQDDPAMTDAVHQQVSRFIDQILLLVNGEVKGNG